MQQVRFDFGGFCIGFCGVLTFCSFAAKSSVVANIPPGVPPIMGTQYIMSQGGMPYFQPPTMYSYEDIQLLQQRIPHMVGVDTVG